MMRLVESFLNSSISVFVELGSEPGIEGRCSGRKSGDSVGVVIVLFWNFFANRIWTYSDAE